MVTRLSPRLEVQVEELLATGDFADAEEVIDEALRLLGNERERLRALRAKLQTGLDQLDRGEGITFTPGWSAERLRLVRERAVAGELPHPDVCP